MRYLLAIAVAGIVIANAAVVAQLGGYAGFDVAMLIWFPSVLAAIVAGSLYFAISLFQIRRNMKRTDNSWRKA